MRWAQLLDAVAIALGVWLAASIVAVVLVEWRALKARWRRRRWADGLAVREALCHCGAKLPLTELEHHLLVAHDQVRRGLRTEDR